MDNNLGHDKKKSKSIGKSRDKRIKEDHDNSCENHGHLNFMELYYTPKYLCKECQCDECKKDRQK